MYDCINLGRRIDVSWPDERMRARGGRSHWRDWLPEKGMEGQVSTLKVLCLQIVMDLFFTDRDFQILIPAK